MDRGLIDFFKVCNFSVFCNLGCGGGWQCFWSGGVQVARSLHNGGLDGLHTGGGLNFGR